VLVKSLSSGARVRPGHNADYAIWVWSARASASNVTVTTSLNTSRHVTAPRFSVCPRAKGSDCQVGYLPKGQADQLRASVGVRGSATAGERLRLTAVVRGTKATSYRSAATIVVAAAPAPTPTPTPSPSPTSPGSVPPTYLPPPTVPPTYLPPVPDTGVAPTDPSNLFPTVSPSPTPSSTGSAPSARTGTAHRHIRTASASALLPFDSRLIGGQLLGLAVLASAIVLAVARLSLRTRKPDNADKES